MRRLVEMEKVFSVLRRTLDWEFPETTFKIFSWTLAEFCVIYDDLLINKDIDKGI